MEIVLIPTGKLLCEIFHYTLQLFENARSAIVLNGNRNRQYQERNIPKERKLY